MQNDLTRVYGTVVDEARSPLPNHEVLIEAFSSTGTATTLACGSTDVEGRYDLEYEATCESRMHIRVTLRGADGQVLEHREILEPAAKQRVDFRIGAARDAPTPRFSEIHARLSRVVGDTSLVELDEVSLVRAALSAGVLPADAAIARMAAVSAKETGLPRELFFALEQGGLSSDVVQALRVSPSARRRAVDLAIERRALTSAQGETARCALDALDRLAFDSALKSDGEIVTPGLAFELAGIGPEGRQVLELWRAVAGDAAAFWREVTLPDEARERLRFVLRLSALTRQNTPLVVRLFRDHRSIEDLAALERSDWEQLVEQCGVPQRDTDGSDYASALFEDLEAAFPTAMLASRTEWFAATDGLRAFLEANPDYDLTGASLREYLRRRPEALDAVPVGTPRDAVRAELPILERLYRISPTGRRFETMRALRQAGVVSATQIQLMGRARFLAHAKGALDEGAAFQVFRTARGVVAAALAVHTQYRAANGATGMVVLPSTFDGTTDDERALLTGLFGGRTFCACEECQAADGSAAYFADLVFWLRGRGTGGALFETLKQRRPDLETLLLSCKNANTAMPSIDLLIEKLEDLLSPADAVDAPDDKDARQTTWDSEDLLARPEHVRESAYRALAAAIAYPFHQPYVVWLEQIRMLLSGLGVERAALLIGLAGGDVAASLSQPEVIAEVLGMNRAAWSVLTGAEAARAPELYALPDPASALRALPAFMTRAGDRSRDEAFTYRDAEDLVRSSYVQGAGELAILFDNVICDADGATWRSEAFDEHLTRIALLLRLQRTMGWSVAELDRAITMFRASPSDGPLARTDVSEPLLRALSGVVWLERTLGASRATVLDWFGPMDTRRWMQRVASASGRTQLTRVPKLDSANDGGPEAERSPFQRAATGSDISLFALPDDGLELVDTSRPIGLHLDAVAAAVSARPEDIGTLLAAAGAPTTLSLSSLSHLRRQVTFARALGISVLELERWRRWTGVDPFAAPHDAIRLAAEVQRQRTVKLGAAEFAQLLADPGTRDLAALNLPSPAEAMLALSDEHRAHAGSSSDDRQRAILRRTASMLELDAALLDGLLELELEERTLRDALLYQAKQVDEKRQDDPTGSADLATIRLVIDARVWEMVALAAWIARAFGIQVEDLRWLIGAPSVTRGFKLETLLIDDDVQKRYQTWAAVREAVRLRSAFENGRVFDLLGALADGELDAPTLRAALSERTGWPLANLAVAIHDGFGGPLGGGTALEWSDPLRVTRLVTWMNLATKLGVAAEPLFRWGSAVWSDVDVTDPVDDYQAHASELEQALLAVLGKDAWRERMPALREPLREKTRAAMVSRIVGAGVPTKGPSPRTFESAGALGQHLLVDPEMGACARTSRLNDATRTVQTFVQRVLLGEELGLRLTDEEAEEWKWRKNFRVWQANRRVFLFPENWIRPELLRDKTPLYQTLINTLSQGDLSDHLVESGYREYLRGLGNIARLEVLAVLRERAVAGGTDTYHVFGRTQGAPRAYYHRTWIDGARWTPWQRIVDAEGDHLIPVLYQGRLVLFWLNVSENASVPEGEIDVPNPGESTPLPGPRHFEIHVSYSELRDGGWSTPVRSDAFIGLNAEGRWSPPHYAETSHPDALLARADVFDGVEPRPVEPKTLLSARAVIEDHGARDLIIACYREREYDRWELARFRFSAVDGAITSERAFFQLPRNGPVSASRSYLPAAQRFIGSDALTLPFPIDEAGWTTDLQTVLHNRADSSASAMVVTPTERVAFSSTLPFVFADPVGSYWVTFDHYGEVSTEREPRLDVPSAGRERLGGQLPERAPQGAAVVDVAGTVRAATAGLDRSGITNLVSDKVLSILRIGRRLASVNGQPVAMAAKGLAVTTTVEVRNQKGEVVVRTETPSGEEPPAYVNIRAEIPEMREPGTHPPVNYVEDGAKIAEYRFRTFFHPHAALMRETLNRFGVFGLLAPSAGEPMDGQDPSPRSTLESRYVLDRVVAPRPTDDLDFEVDGAYAQYNWELFFHAPFLIAARLHEAGRYLEALEWLHVIFDPHRSLDESGSVRSYWRFRPFRERFATDRDAPKNIRQLIALLTSNRSDASAREDARRILSEIAAWRRNPFDPHAIARTRITAYMAAVAMRYVDVLLDYGDQQFAQYTLESIAEATELFLLAARILGPRPTSVDAGSNPPRTISALLEAFDNGVGPLETLEESLTEVWEVVDDEFPEEADSLPTLLYFCVPPNDYIETQYWERVADRLFKIRHCLDLEGRRRDLALFEPPIDPELLVRAAASGVDLQTLLGEVMVGHIPHRRYAVLAEVAAALAGGAQALGQALLGAIERRDSDQLQRLQALHERTLHSELLASRALELEEAEQQSEALRRNREGVEIQLQFYKDKPRTSPKEDAEKDAANTAKDFADGAAAASGLATVLGLIPLLDGGVAGAGGTPKVSVGFGGPQLAAVANAAASMLNTQAGLYDRTGRMQLVEAGYDRREEGWKLQASLAEKEREAIDRRIAASDIRVALATRALSTAKKRNEQLDEIRNVLERRFGREELFDWMASSLSGLHFQSYQLAYETAKKAERAWAYELGKPADFIRFGYWDSRRKGLLAAERLGHDLRRMQVAYLDEARRRPEIEQTFSLREIDPVALLRLQETGETRFTVPEAFFDLYYPGHYRRRIRAVRFTIPAVVPPGANVPAMFSLEDHWVRTEAKLDDASLVRHGVGQPPVSSVATSSAQRDGGAFDLDFQSPRLLPFEGAGAISAWSITLPKVVRPFRYRDIQDVLLHLAYDAEYEGTLHRALDQEPSPVRSGLLGTSPPRRRVISFRQELGSVLRQLRASPVDTPIRFTLDAMTFPHYLDGAGILNPRLVLRTSRANGASETELRFNDTLVGAFTPWTEAGDGTLYQADLTGALGDLLSTHTISVKAWGGVDPVDPELDILLALDLVA